MNKQQAITLIITLASVILVAGIIYKSNKSMAKPQVTTAPVMAKKITTDELATHNNSQSCWVVVDGAVYDVTGFIPVHPGGPDKILPHCGGDATNAFVGKGHSPMAKEKLATMKVGTLQ